MAKGQCGTSPEAWEKLAAGLRMEIERRRGELDAELPVMIRLKPVESGAPGERRESVAQRDANFAAEAAGLAEQLGRGKARDIQRFWINRTVAAKAKIATICEIAERPDVTEILLLVPHKAVI